MTTLIADDYAYIAEMLKKIEQEKLQEVLAAPLPDVADAKIVYDAYGYPNGVYTQPTYHQDYDPA